MYAFLYVLQIPMDRVRVVILWCMYMQIQMLGIRVCVCVCMYAWRQDVRQSGSVLKRTNNRNHRR